MPEYNLAFSKIIDEDIDSCYNYINDKLEAPMAAENYKRKKKNIAICLCASE